MPQIYKVCVLNHLNDNSNEVFAIKPYLDSFDSFKDEIYIRLPELKNQQFRIYYEGKCSHFGKNTHKQNKTNHLRRIVYERSMNKGNVCLYFESSFTISPFCKNYYISILFFSRYFFFFIHFML